MTFEQFFYKIDHMKFRREKKFKKCPRCGNKCLVEQARCEECDLIFSRLEFASNKAAKRHILHRDSDYVIQTEQLPKDVKRWKIMLLSVLTGLVGGHYYYVGKFIKGALMSLMFVFLVFATIFNSQIVALGDSATTLFYFPIGIYGFAWLISLVYVFCGKFRVPVIVEMPTAEVEKEQKQHDEILSATKTLKDLNAQSKNENLPKEENSNGQKVQKKVQNKSKSGKKK